MIISEIYKAIGADKALQMLGLDGVWVDVRSSSVESALTRFCQETGYAPTKNFSIVRLKPTYVWEIPAIQIRSSFKSEHNGKTITLIFDDEKDSHNFQHTVAEKVKMVEAS